MATKKIKAKVLYDFEDLQENVIRHSGDVFFLTETRFNEINKKAQEMFGMAYIEEVLEETK
ncbi:MAG: hypothetical protein JNG49_07325 [Peptostreptococcus stomatis]|uniref:hypothetical protein n=1 Tax=Peptostreptococcus stomatis TaxID=341694 RepID=UPI001A4E9C82|nr:hypothetical protein [Peptostreptococcus stomatis]MBL6466208.1 hypothetical protein [Peptostreptococcus stomatis]